MSKYSSCFDDHKNNINKHTTDGESDLDIELALADIIIVNCADTDPDTDNYEPEILRHALGNLNLRLLLH